MKSNETFLIAENCSDCGAESLSAVYCDNGAEVFCEDCEAREWFPSMIEVGEIYFVVPDESN